MTPIRPLAAAAVLCLSGLLLTACASDPKNPARTAANPGELYPLKTEQQSDRIALAMHAEGLSRAQADALKALAARRRAQAGGMVQVSAPHGAADPALAAKAAAAARAVLVLEGADSQLTAYESDDPKAPLLVSYGYEAASVPACGKHWDDLTHTEDNHVQSNFGCALSANMAAQMAYPSDIGHPKAEDPVDAGRRMTVLSAYAAGKSTAAESKDDKAGVVSHVGP